MKQNDKTKDSSVGLVSLATSWLANIGSHKKEQPNLLQGPQSHTSNGYISRPSITISYPRETPLNPLPLVNQ